MAKRFFFVRMLFLALLVPAFAAVAAGKRQDPTIVLDGAGGVIVGADYRNGAGAVLPEDYYKRLITARRVQVQKYNGPNPRWSQTYMSGAVMLSDADTSWNDPPDAPQSSPLPRPPIEFLADPLPLPDLDSYFAQKMPLTQPYVNPGGAGNYTLDAGIGGAGFFYRPPNSPADLWTVDENHNPATITVRGTVIWLADPGIVFRRNVQVLGNPATDRLIIVARPKDRSEATGAINFEGGIISDVPMILVSDGKVRFDCQPSYDFSSRVSYLSIYSGRVQIAGPEESFPPVRMDLMHTSSLLPNQLDPIIDQLYLLNVLPSPGGVVSVGSHVASTLALDPLRPNPSRGGVLTVHFTLSSEAAAFLELLDVAGRRVAIREVGSLGPGSHSVDFGEGVTLRPGIYLFRLKQGGNEVCARAAVIR